jgi:hypothetical protein
VLGLAEETTRRHGGAYCRLSRIWSFENVTQERLRVFGHDGAGECIALVGTKVVAIPPASTDELLEIGAGVEILVVRTEVIQ